MFFSHPLSPTGRYFLAREEKAFAGARLVRPILAELFERFSYQAATVSFTPTDAPVFYLGNAAPLPAPAVGYAIRVEETGAAVSAADEENLVKGYLTLLDMIAMDEEGRVFLPFCRLQESAIVPVRMVHFCVFPETELWEIRKFLRLAGVLKYTHVILEFWGMLRYDCLAELALPNAYRKEEIRPLIAEAQDLGVEVVPMFNHWGHAAGARMMHGKHAVLDQNPRLQYLFDDSGWCWNFRSERVVRLLREVRRELCELCGAGTCFHIGGDEAYTFRPEECDALCAYLNGIAGALRREGRRAILWGDMLLSPTEADRREGYSMSAPTPACAAQMRAALSHDILVADWQYEVKRAPLRSSLLLRDAGFSTLLCPWDRSADNVDACLQTVREAGLFGVLHTTWHTLSAGMPYVGRVAARCWETPVDGGTAGDALRTAAILRRVFDAGGHYARTGFAKQEIGVIF